MAYNPILGMISDEEMQKHLSQKKAQSFSVPQAFEDGVYEFTKHNNALYIHQGTENFRVLEFQLGQNQGGARDIGLKITSDAGDVEGANLAACSPDDAARLALALKNLAVNVEIGNKGYVQKPLMLSTELAQTRANQPMAKSPIEPKKPKEKEKPKKLWDDCLKEWVKMGLQTGGGFLLMLVIVGVFPAALAGWLAIGGLLTLSFANQIVDFGEKIVKKAYGKVVKFNDWMDYRADLRDFKHTQKDVWANPTKVRKKAIKPRIDKEKHEEVVASSQGMHPHFGHKFGKLSKKKSLGKTQVNNIDLSAGL